MYSQDDMQRGGLGADMEELTRFLDDEVTQHPETKYCLTPGLSLQGRDGVNSGPPELSAMISWLF